MLLIRNLTVVMVIGLLAGLSSAQTTATRPNILWISCEDYSPDFSFYGDIHSYTPNLDKLAAAGCVFTRAFSTAPVCAPSRSSIITGLYAASIGTHHMRTSVPLPAGVHPFTTYLREAGYFCTNNWKTDYNFPIPKGTWDENSRKAHWRHRKSKDQPFFAVFNFTVTHEGKYKMPERRYKELVKDVRPEHRANPDELTPPPYFPNTPATRNDWARHYTMATQMDIEAGRILQQLEDDGLTSNTIIFFSSDHGVGLPRNKRWLYDAGLHVPLVVKWPGSIRPGSHNEELVSLMDLAPTVMSLAGLKPASNMQGRIFIGPEKQPEPDYLFATRDRIDSAEDLSRTVRDRRFRYIKNFFPERPWSQRTAYAEGNPTMIEMRKMLSEGTLTGPATMLFQPRKPAEELYDTLADPYQVHNLANEPGYQLKLKSMRATLTQWQADIDDKGLQPEPLEQKQWDAERRRKKNRPRK